GRETPLTTGAVRDHAPQFSPDGKWVAFERDNHELRVIDVSTRQEHVVASAILFAPRDGAPHEFAWSPDSKYLTYVATAAKSFQNLHVAAVDGAAGARATTDGTVSFLANTNGGSVAWSPDGAYRTFVSSQRTEPGQVVRVDLIP